MDDDRSSISVPEEIVADILVRLHIRPLFKFKLVSKRWNSFISDPEFGQNYLQRLRSSPKSSSSGHLCAMLNPWGKPEKSRDLSNSVYTFHDIDRDPPPSLHMSTFPRCKVNEETQILPSSSGLILSRHYLAPKGRRYHLCVSNPLTKQSILLPPLNVYLKVFRWVIGFSTRNNPTYLTYKVVVILNGSLADSNKSTIMVFSSDKGYWTCKKPMFACPKVLFRADRASSCKGVLYWFHSKSRSIVTYDPYDTPDSFGHIQFPIGSDNVLRNSSLHLIQFGHEDMLKYVDIECVNDVERELRVWHYDKGEWCLKQKCPISPRLSNSFLNAMRLVGPDPWNDGFFGCLGAKAIDLRRAEDIFVYMKATTPFDGMRNLIPIALCPWSSPFYGLVKCNSSSIVGFRKISPVWCTSSCKK